MPILLIIRDSGQAYLGLIENTRPADGPFDGAKTMNKTLMIAAALLSLGVTSAFAGEDFPDRFAAPVNQSALAQQATGHNQLFPSSSRQTVSVYDRFVTPGSQQGGQQ